MKKPALRSIVKYGSLVLFVGLSLTILIESAFKGEESTKQSDAFANPIQDALNKEYDEESLVDIEDFSLTFDKDGSTFEVGDTLAYAPSFSPENTSYTCLSFEALENASSDGEVLRIDEARNEIRFEKEGEATLLVSSLRHPEIQKSYSFLVQNIPLSDFEILDPSGKGIDSIHLKEGESLPLSFALSPSSLESEDFAITSSQEDSLGVDETFRCLYAKKPGTGNISISSKRNPELKKSIPFAVLEREEPLPTPTLELSFSANEILEAYERPSSDFKAIPLGSAISVAITENGKKSEDVSFLSSDPSILSVGPDGGIKALKEGRATIKAVSKANCGVALSCEIEVVPSVAPFLLDVDALKALNQEGYQNEKGETYAYWAEIAYGKTYRITPSPEKAFTSSFSFELLPVEGGKKEAIAVDNGGRVSTLGLGSGTILVKASNGLYECVQKITLHVVRDRKWSWNDVTTVVRKTIGHFGLFALTALSILPFLFLTWGGKKARSLALLGSEAIGFGLAGFSELIQFYTEGRSGNWVDVGIDMAGYTSVVLIAYAFLLISFLRSLRKKKSESDANPKAPKEE